MAWYPQTEAAALLKVSTRTLRRHVTAGRYRTRRDGRVVLVEVPDGQEVSDVGRQLAGVATANAIQRVKDSETMADTLSVLSDFRVSLETQAHQARRSARLAWSAVAVLVLVGAVGLWWSTREMTTATARADVLAETVTAERTRADKARHHAELTIQAVQLELSKAQAQLEDGKARLEMLRPDLPGAGPLARFDR